MKKVRTRNILVTQFRFLLRQKHYLFKEKNESDTSKDTSLEQAESKEDTLANVEDLDKSFEGRFSVRNFNNIGFN